MDSLEGWLTSKRVVDIKGLIGPRAGRAFPQAPRERSVQGLRAVGGRRAPEHFDSDLAPPGTDVPATPSEDTYCTPRPRSVDSLRYRHFNDWLQLHPVAEMRTMDALCSSCGSHRDCLSHVLVGRRLDAGSGGVTPARLPRRSWSSRVKRTNPSRYQRWLRFRPRSWSLPSRVAFSCCDHEFAICEPLHRLCPPSL
jgi:hypothetical protein